MNLALSMPRRAVVLTGASTLLLGLLLGLAASVALPPARSGGGGTRAAAAGPAPAPQASPAGPPAFTEVVQAVLPSVVTVRSQRTVEVSRLPSFFHPFFDEPGEPPGGGRGRTERRLQRGLGSGVVVDERGYILTNNHVVEDSSKIEVVLAQGRTVPARIRGTDPQTDLAVLEIEAADLTPLTMGSSGELQVGEWVLAVGNPFAEQLAHTVTAGIVSAKGRSNIRLAEIEDFIQTDAAINPGNSGGALVDARGRLVGINTAIASGTGSFQGIGFAIPVDMAREIMQHLIESGRVVRGYLGVVIQNLTPEMARAGGIQAEKGAIVAEVEEGGPAADAGLRQGDVVTAIDGTEVSDSTQLRNVIASSPPGTKVRLSVERNGRSTTLAATLGEKPAAPRRAQAPSAGSEEGLGLALRDLRPPLDEQLGMRGERGVVVQDVEPGSAADEAGLQPGDVIKEVNRRSVASVAEFREALARGRRTGVSLFLVRRADQTVYVTVQSPEGAGGGR
ncbi:MAG TPA: Do family serine endopeptidase [Candidatus Polarisedimenticolia bacterium]|nr:Do family serine endopeptidase [Candidatus Polarisedimenticolia bacterium]